MKNEKTWKQYLKENDNDEFQALLAFSVELLGNKAIFNKNNNSFIVKGKNLTIELKR